MTKAIRQFPFHVFLLPAFFVLHILNNYFGLMPGKAYATVGGYYLLLSVLLLLGGRLLLGSYNKAGLWTTGLLIIFYFFGSFHDFLKSLSFPSLLTSYTLLLTSILIISIAYFFYLKRHKGTFSKVHQYLNILFVVFTLIEITSIIYNIITNKREQNNYAHAQPPVLNTLPEQEQAKPDIFFIVFDEYTSSLALKKYFNYNNSFIDSTLHANNFYIATKAQSNYNSTPLSIGSGFNMQYFDQPLEKDKTTTKSILQALYTLKKSHLPRLLAGKGYDIYNFGLCDLGHYPVHTTRTFAEYETLPLYQETLWGRIERDIWWNMFKYKIPILNKIRSRQYTQKSWQLVITNRTNFQLTLDELNKQSARPKFVFMHVMMPHAPFLLDENGNFNATGTDMYDTAGYLQQLTWCNKWIDSLARAANQLFPRPRVVIIEGDHGFRDRKPAIREKQFMNLNAYYFSDKDHTTLYDSISPINTFKVISNKYFHTTLTLSPDSTILLY